jgi:hypothetical protein
MSNSSRVESGPEFRFQFASGCESDRRGIREGPAIGELNGESSGKRRLDDAVVADDCDRDTDGEVLVTEGEEADPLSPSFGSTNG